MIEKSRIENIVSECIKGTDIFLVSVKASGSNRILVTVDTAAGISLDQCVDLHRRIETNIDRNSEDFELQVSSPGLDMPFKVIEQYYRYEGSKVEVISTEGEKFSGKLKNVTGGGFELETEIKVKGKTKEKKDISFNSEQIKSTRVILTIK